MHNSDGSYEATPDRRSDGTGASHDRGYRQFAHVLQERVQQRRTAAGTARAYLADVRDFVAHLARQGVDSLKATSAQVRAYLDELSATRQASTLRRKVTSLRSFYQELMAQGLLQHNPIADLQLPASRRHSSARPSPLPAPTVRQLLAAPPNTPKGVRDRALLAAMACHGLTVGEICALDVTDVDLQANTLRVTGRRARVRIVALIPQTAVLFRGWLAARSLLRPDTPALFISLHWTAGRSLPGGRISARGVRQLVRRYLAQVGVSQPGLSCQTLRRTYIALTLAAGADLRAVAASVGHASTATTHAYAADVELVQENPARYLAGLL